MDNELKPVKEGVFEVGPPPRLRGAICSVCKQKFFPKPVVACPQCLGELQDIYLSTEGKVYTYAILRVKPPYGLPSPYAVGMVDLEADGIKVFTLFDPETLSELDFGKRVTLRVGEMGVGNDRKRCLRYYFTPQVGGGKSEIVSLDYL